MKATLTHTEKRITTRENRVEGIVMYDIDNNYPNRVRDICDNSSMGNTCVNIYGKYIFGRGFQNTTFAKTLINSTGLTPDKLLRKIKDDLKYLGGFCVHVNYNSLFQICEYNYQPLAHVRFTNEDDKEHPNMFAVHKDFGLHHAKKIDKKTIRYFNKFNTNVKTIAREIEAAGGIENYQGQLFYFTNEEGNYPKPIYDCALEDMQTDSGVKTYKARNISSNFMASHMVVIDPIEGSATTPNSTAENEKNAFIQSLEQYQGADNANKLIVVEKDSVGQTFQIIPIEQQKGDTLFQYTEESTRNNIREAFLIPSILLTETGGKLIGNADEINDAINAYNSVTEDERLHIEEAFRVLFEYYVNNINTTLNYSIIPKKTIAKDDALTKQNITAVVKDTQLSVSQKIEILTKQYDLDMEDATILVNPVDSIVQPPCQRLQGNQLTEMTVTICSEYLTKVEKKGILMTVYGLSANECEVIFPNNEPDVVNPTAKPS